MALYFYNIQSNQRKQFLKTRGSNRVYQKIYDFVEKYYFFDFIDKKIYTTYKDKTFEDNYKKFE